VSRPVEIRKVLIQNRKEKQRKKEENTKQCRHQESREHETIRQQNENSNIKGAKNIEIKLGS
jgi:hypothetical protein